MIINKHSGQHSGHQRKQQGQHQREDQHQRKPTLAHQSQTRDRRQTQTFDILIIGAGAAGLAAAERLAKEGFEVCVLDARNRLGGRIHTIRDPAFARPVELGAEFIHGDPEEIWGRVRNLGLETEDVPDQHHMTDGSGIEPLERFWDRVGQVMDHLHDQANHQDRSFQEALAKTPVAGLAENKALTTSFVEGFHAADARRISTQLLLEAEAQINDTGGYRICRIVDGYDALLRAMAGSGFEIRLNTIVTDITWSKDHVRVDMNSSAGHRLKSLRARRCIVTVPVGVLKADPDSLSALRFHPKLPSKTAALQWFDMGAVVKIVLKFSHAFWKPAELNFLVSRTSFRAGGPPIPTWWTSLPAKVPQLTGWAGGPAALELAGSSESIVVRKAIDSLASCFHLPVQDLWDQLRGWQFHDWQADPFSMGAYSYVLAGGVGQRQTLAAPVEGTLFFAGEATQVKGQNGTVDGAISSGLRAADEVLQKEGKPSWRVA